MHFSIFDVLRGFGIGILISVPLGPVGLITMKRTAEFGLWAGIVSGLAIVLIDTVGTIIVLLGFHRSFHYIHPLPAWVHVAGSVVIFLYGVRVLFSNPTRTIDEALPWHKHFLSAAVLALTNPSTYFSFGVIGLMLSRFIGTPFYTRIEVAIGFFLGALVWWCTLAFIAFSQRDRYFATTYIQRIVGITIMVLALSTFIPFRTYHHAAQLFHSSISQYRVQQ